MSMSSEDFHNISFFYIGTDVPDHVLKILTQQLTNHLIMHNIMQEGGVVSIVHKDSEGMATSIAKDVLMAKLNQVEDVNSDPVENALMYISNRYAGQLETANLIPLILRVSEDIRSHKSAISQGKEGDILLINALDIMCDKTINSNILAKYGISERAANAIRECYKLAPNII